MTRASFALLLVGCSLLGACHRREDKASPSPEPRPPSSAELEAARTAKKQAALEGRTRDTVAWLERVASAHEAGKASCDTLTGRLTDFVAEDPPPTRDPEVFRRTDEDSSLGTRTHHAMETIMTESMKCRGHAGFEALHARLRAR